MPLTSPRGDGTRAQRPYRATTYEKVVAKDSRLDPRHTGRRLGNAQTSPRRLAHGKWEDPYNAGMPQDPLAGQWK